jgi:hypothetical protein
MRQTSRTCNNSLPSVFDGEMRHLVVRPADLEAEHGLEVLALEKHLIPQPRSQIDRRGDRCLFEYIVDAGGENKAEILLPRSVTTPIDLVKPDHRFVPTSGVPSGRRRSSGMAKFTRGRSGTAEL